MEKSMQNVIQVTGFRLVVQLLVIIYIFFFFQIDAFAQKFSFEFEGIQREYVVYLPQEFQPNSPIVFGFHGYRQGSNFISYTRLHEVADAAGFITVYPQSNPYWNTGLLYPGYPQIDTTVNDVGFISALIDTLYARYEIDLSRIYSCGFSHGGGMTNVLSGELSNRFAAVASVAGLFNDNSATGYNPMRPIPTLHIHGTEDIIETWDGSKANLWSVDSTLSLKLEKNGCLLIGDTIFLPDLDNTDGCMVEKISFINCTGDGQLVFYKIMGGGHSWPDSKTTFGNEGNKNRDINANVEIINFFRKFENPFVYIPDTAFLNALLELEVDTNGDSLISYTEAGAINTLDVGGTYDAPGNIVNLTGIEAFINLDSLFCNNNSINSINISSLSKLVNLHCDANQLNSLDVLKNTALRYLFCGGNPFTSLDLSACTSLEVLGCHGNQLTNLDISNNTSLNSISLGCSDLHEVCVWTTPFPPEGVYVDAHYNDSICFETDCNGACGNVVSGIAECNQTGWVIYPNPTNNLLTIETENPDHYSIEITSLNGQLVYSDKFMEANHQINLSSFKRGTYLLTIISRYSVTTKKIIKF